MALRAVIAAALVCIVPSSARAATIPVTTGGDGIANDGQCTLREAINSANADAAVGGCPAGSGADEVTIPALQVTLSANPAASDTIATGDLDLAGAVTVRGAGADLTIVDGARKDRVFDVAVNATATIRDLTVTGGEVPAAGAGASIFGQFGDSVIAGAGFPGGDGGGIRNRGTLTVTDAAIVDNRAGAGGPGGQAVGGDCSVPGDCNATPGGEGEAGDGGSGGRGGGIASVSDPLPAVLTVQRTRIAANHAGAGGRGGDGSGGGGDDANPGGQNGGDAFGGYGGAGGAGGGIWAGGALTVSASTVADNLAGAGGRGGDAFGGDGGDGSNNPSDGGHGGTAGGGLGGAGGAGGGVDAAADATIEDSLLSSNAAGPGGRSGNAVGGDGGNGVGTGKGGAGQIAGGNKAGDGGAGGAVRGSSLTLRRLLLSGNSAGIGGDGGNATAGAPGTPLPTVTGGGLGGTGGAGGSGGAVSGAGTVADSTLHANSAANGGHGGNGLPVTPLASNGSGGGGGSGGGASHGAGTLGLTRVTVTADSAGAGGAPGTTPGISAGSTGAAGTGPALQNSGGSTILGESIVAESGASACSGAIDDGGNNFRFPASNCPGFTQDPQLGPLADNGGPTRTRALAPTSPALDRAGCSGADQRGVARPAGAQCDSGAYEFAPPVVSGDAAIEVTGTTATLRAGVNPNARPTTVRFEYGPTLALGSATAEISVPAGVSAVTMAVPVVGLTPLTTYHFRAVATNGDGSTTGPDGIFTTGFPPQLGPTTAQFETAVTRELADVIAALRRLGTAKLGRTGTFSFVATLPGGGVFAVAITAPNATLSAARTVLVGKARTTFRSAGSKRIRIKLTRNGRRLMKKTRRRVKLKVTTTFTPTGRRAIKRTKTFKLRRR